MKVAKMIIKHISNDISKIMKDYISFKENDCVYVVFEILMIMTFMLFVAAPVDCHAGKKDKLLIGQFSQGKVDNWEKKVFAGESRYQLAQVDGRTVLKGMAKKSASGLFRKKRVDLTQTPFLNWSWRVDKPHSPLDERSKQGDDYAARVYIVVDGGVLFWKTIALNYVWSSSQPAGNYWASSYAGKNVMLLALRSNKQHLPSVWYREKRNVYKDFKRLFNKEITAVDAVAIMTDSDNSGGDVLACYGDIYFSAE